ncbi:MAG: hypothetical protein AAF804_15045, partial [Bacteroidota bacterium]
RGPEYAKDVASSLEWKVKHENCTILNEDGLYIATIAHKKHASKGLTARPKTISTLAHDLYLFHLDRQGGISKQLICSRTEYGFPSFFADLYQGKGENEMVFFSTNGQKFRLGKLRW